LKIRQDTFSCSDIRNSKGDFGILPDGLSHARAEAVLKTRVPLDEVGRVVSTDGDLINFRKLECPLATGCSAETEMEIVADGGGPVCRNCILDPFAEGIDVSINRIFSDCNNVAGRISVVDRKVRFEQSEFFYTPTCVTMMCR
jgi:hypothetical protein